MSEWVEREVMGEETNGKEKADTAKTKSAKDSVVQKRKLGRWAQSSLICGVLAWVLLVLAIGVTLLLDRLTRTQRIVITEEARGTISVAFRIYFLFAIILSIIALLSGVIHLIGVKLKRSTTKGTQRAIAGVLLGVFFLGGIFMVSPAYTDVIRQKKSIDCGRNLYALGEAIRMYARDNDGKYPVADKWCDLLVQGGYATYKQFICPASPAGKGQSSYALNVSAAEKRPVDLPPNIVLLFESTPGWNRFGGSELITTENHSHISGCNVLLNDGKVRFETADNLWELIWLQKPNDKPDSK